MAGMAPTAPVYGKTLPVPMGGMQPGYSTGMAPTPAPMGGGAGQGPPPPSGAPSNQMQMGGAPMPPQQQAYSGVPVVVNGQPGAGGAGATNAMNALYQMGAGPVNVAPLNAATQATLDQERLMASNAAAYGASAAFGQGAAGTPVQGYAQNQVTQSMIPLNAQMMNTQANYYNQANQNQIAALGQSGQLGLGASQNDLAGQVALQNALFGANQQNLNTQGQAFNQNLQSQQQQMNMYGQMNGYGQQAQGNNQANLDAMYQMYGTSDPMQILMQIMGQTPMGTQPNPNYGNMAPGLGMLGLGASGMINAPAPGINPQGGSASPGQYGPMP